MANLLITGATGYIGGALLERLVTDAAHSPVVAVRTDNSGSLFNVPRVSVGKISAETQWSVALADAKVVIHAAGRAHMLKISAGNSQQDFNEVNVDGTLCLARQAADMGIKRFLFISSIGVIGNRSNQPFTEEDVPHPLGFYAISKLEAEKGLFEIAKETGMEVVIIRPPLVYGPKAPGNFDRLMRLVNLGWPLPLGSICNKRSFVGLDNLVDLIVTCIDHPAAADETFLAGDGEDISTVELLQHLGRALGKPVRLVSVPEVLLKMIAVLSGRRGEVERLCDSLQVDISKARKRLGWEPPVSLEEGLRASVKDFQSDL